MGYLTFRAKPPTPPGTVSTVAEIETYLDDLVAFGTPPGLTVVVVKDGEIRYTKGFGLVDAPNRLSAAPETVYKWWSMTKVFTAVAIMQLHEQERLDIDKPVAEYLPYFYIEYTADIDEEITVRHVLNHSSGIPDNVPEVMGWMHLEDQQQPNNSEFLKSVFPSYAQLNFAPGTRSEYTNVGYMVLGSVIEKVTETTYEDYVLENILAPLEMNQTNFVYTSEMEPVAAAGSHPLVRWETPLLPFLFDDWRAFIRETVDQRLWFNRFYADSNPPTGLIGPTDDLAAFLLAFLNAGKYEGERILTEHTVSQMSTESIVRVMDTGQTDTNFQGMGWEVEKDGDSLKYLAHGGGGPGFGCAMRIYPNRDLAMAVLANDTTYDRGVILDLLEQLEWE